MKNASILFLLIFLVALCTTFNCFAEETDEDKRWTFNLAPFFLWGVTIDGEMTFGTDTTSVEVSFNDLFDSLEAAYIVHLEAMHKSNWGFLIDIDRLDVSNTVVTSDPSSLEADAKFQMTIAELSGLYRIKKIHHSIDIVAGIRYAGMSSKVVDDTSSTILFDDREYWVDPLVGLRWIWGFADKWSLVMRGDIGGFGVGSQLSTQGQALFDWQPFENVSFLAGYRAIYEDYDQGSGSDLFRFDATIHGPLLGLNFRW